MRVQDVQLQGIKDELILEWAGANGFILLTHDANTMTEHAYGRITRGLLMPGMVVIQRKTPIGEIVSALEMLIECARPDEWENRIWFVPF